MGIKLVIEVLDQYHGPDARKLWLIAWAEKANDRTRAGWPTREVLAHRTGRSPSRASHIAEELVTEGVLKRDGGGNRGGPARYILLPVTNAGKSAPRAHPKGGVKGADEAHPATPSMGAPNTHPSETGKGAASAHPKPEVKGAESARKGAESGRKGADLKPLPAETGSLPLIPSVDQPSLIPTGDTSEPAGPPVTAQTILAAFIDWVRANEGDLTKRTIGQIAKQIGDLLAQGKDERHIRTGLGNWYLADKNPATLDSFVNSAINAAARERLAHNGQGQGVPVDKREQARQARLARAMERARAREEAT